MTQNLKFERKKRAEIINYQKFRSNKLFFYELVIVLIFTDYIFISHIFRIKVQN